MEIPQHIITSVKDGKTSLGHHDAFPPENENLFIVNLMNKRFGEVSAGIGDFTDDELRKKLSRYISKAQSLEKNSIGSLETLCMGIVNDMFKIPQDTIHIYPHLVTKVDTSSERLKPESIDDFEFENIQSINNLTNEIYKRRLLNALVAGASAFYANDVSSYVSELFTLNPELPLLYEKINTCNDYLLFVSKDELQEDSKSTDAGKVEVFINGTEDMPRINSYGITFPVMLEETIKGLLEVACTYGLPDNLSDAQFVMKKADFKLAKKWDLRIGYPLWVLIDDLAKTVLEGDTILTIGLNYFFKELSLTPTEEFNQFMQEIFAKTKQGKENILELCNRVIDGLDSDDFNNYMKDKASEIHQMNDSIGEYQYFTPDELSDDGELIVDSVNENINKKLKSAEKQVDINPTKNQIEAGNYKKGHVNINGFHIVIEQPKNSIRSGVDENGKEWSNKIYYTYGYIRGVKSVDGDDIDVFLSDNPLEGDVYVIDQINCETRKFDEHKCMIGFNSYDEAKKAYLKNYEKNWQGLGRITKVSWEEFKEWVNSSNRKTKPFYEYNKIKKLDATKGRKKINEVRGRVDDKLASEVKKFLVPYIKKRAENGNFKSFTIKMLDIPITIKWQNLDSEALAAQTKIYGKNIILLNKIPFILREYNDDEILSLLMHEFIHVLQSKKEEISYSNTSADIIEDGTKTSSVAKAILYFISKDEVYARLSSAYYDVMSKYLNDASEQENPVKFLSDKIKEEMKFDLFIAAKRAINEDTYLNFSNPSSKTSLVRKLISVKNDFLYFDDKNRNFTEGQFNKIKSTLITRINKLMDTIDRKIDKMVYDLLQKVRSA